MVKVRNSIKWQDYAFVFILISDLISLAVGNENIHAFIKPLVVPSIAFFFFSKELIKFKIGKYLALVLLFSWLGDILLIFDSSLHFLLGLFSFLIAHFFLHSDIFFDHYAFQNQGHTHDNHFILFNISCIHSSNGMGKDRKFTSSSSNLHDHHFCNGRDSYI